MQPRKTILTKLFKSAQSDKVTYQGVVIDENGNPLPGVNITYKNAHGVGVITDIDGKFTFAIPSNIHSLIFSYVGMKTQTVRVSNPSKKLKVRLEPDAVLKCTPKVRHKTFGVHYV